MILHVMSDDKFADYVIDQFVQPQMKSDLVVIPYAGNMQMVSKQDQVRIVRRNSPEFEDLLNNLGNYSAIVLHGLFWPYDETIIRRAPKNVKIAWFFWGGEIYSRADLLKNFLAPLTRLMDSLHQSSQKETKKVWELPIELYDRIDYCLTSLPEEYEYVKRYLKHDSLKFIWYTCYSIEETVGELMNARATGDNVWFCNSAAKENNMFDALVRLGLFNRRQLRGKKVIMPLSYGNPWVRNTMMKLGPTVLGKHFTPLLEYMPRDEYNAQMLDCSTMILPYYCPAGQGNILTALWLGMRVYLSKYCLALDHFKNIGAKVYSFEDEFRKYGYSKMTDDDVAYNRAVLLKWYGNEHVKQSCVEMVEILDK